MSTVLQSPACQKMVNLPKAMGWQGQAVLPPSSARSRFPSLGKIAKTAGNWGLLEEGRDRIGEQPIDNFVLLVPKQSTHPLPNHQGPKQTDANRTKQRSAFFCAFCEDSCLEFPRSCGANGGAIRGRRRICRSGAKAADHHESGGAIPESVAGLPLPCVPIPKEYLDYPFPCVLNLPGKFHGSRQVSPLPTLVWQFPDFGICSTYLLARLRIAKTSEIPVCFQFNWAQYGYGSNLN